MTIHHGYTKSVPPSVRTRNEYKTCLEFLQHCKNESEAEYWFQRLVSAFEALREYATAQERIQHICILIDFALVDPAHRRYADKMADHETPMQTRASLGV